jgi:hypothetical protein
MEQEHKRDDVDVPVPAVAPAPAPAPAAPLARGHNGVRDPFPDYVGRHALAPDSASDADTDADADSDSDMSAVTNNSWENGRAGNRWRPAGAYSPPYDGPADVFEVRDSPVRVNGTTGALAADCMRSCVTL